MEEILDKIMLRIFLFCFVFELTKLPSKPAGCVSPNYPNADTQHPAQVGNTQVLGSAHTLATYSPRHCVDSEGNRCDLRRVRGTGPDAGRKNSNVKLGREGETEKSQFRHKNTIQRLQKAVINMPLESLACASTSAEEGGQTDGCSRGTR